MPLTSYHWKDTTSQGYYIYSTEARNGDLKDPKLAQRGPPTLDQITLLGNKIRSANK